MTSVQYNVAFFNLHVWAVLKINREAVAGLR